MAEQGAPRLLAASSTFRKTLRLAEKLEGENRAASDKRACTVASLSWNLFGCAQWLFRGSPL